MDSSRVRSLRALLVTLAVVVTSTWVAQVDARPYYDDGAGVGCVSCHPGFTGGPAPVRCTSYIPSTFSIGSNCTLCHQTFGGEKPVLTYWSSGGFGCSGCHGSVYGETTGSDDVPTLPHLGQPRSTAYGLRAKHALEGVTVCATCHFPGSAITGEPDPAPAIHPETFLPPYYTPRRTTSPIPAAPRRRASTARSAWTTTATAMPTTLATRQTVSSGLRLPGVRARPPTTTTTTTTSTTLPSGAPKRITVYPGQSIQDAVDAVAPGGTVSVMPGTYQETHVGTNAVTITKNGIKLIAQATKTDEGDPAAAPPGRRTGSWSRAPSTAAHRRRQDQGLHRRGLPEQRHLDALRGQLHRSRRTSRSTTWRTASGRPCPRTAW